MGAWHMVILSLTWRDGVSFARRLSALSGLVRPDSGQAGPTIPCLQSTFKLSKTVSHLAVNDTLRHSETVCVGLRCGQKWWSGSCLGSKDTVKQRLTVGFTAPDPPSWDGELVLLISQDAAGTGAHGGDHSVHVPDHGQLGCY